MTFRIFIHTSYVSCMSQVKEEDSDEEEDIDENDPSRPQLVPIPPDPTDATDLKEGNHSIFDRCSLEVRRYTALIRVCCKADSTRKAYLHHLKNYKDWLVQHSRIQVGTEMESHLQGCRTSWLQEGLLSRSVDGVFRAQVQRIKRVWEEGGIVSTERAFHFLQWLADWLHGEKSGLRQAASALGFWAGIETIIRGTKRVPMIASSVSIAAILEAADKSWIRRELGYIPGQRNVAPASPYTPPTIPVRDIQRSALSNGYSNSQFNDLLALLARRASDWEKQLGKLEEEDRILLSLDKPAMTNLRWQIREARGKVHDCLQTHIFATIAHHTLVRGDTIRGFQFAHIYTRELETVRGSKCVQLTFVADRGKTVKDGKVHHYSVVRSKVAKRCPVGAVFLWIHYLYDCLGECTCVPLLFTLRSLKSHTIWPEMSFIIVFQLKG